MALRSGSSGTLREGLWRWPQRPFSCWIMRLRPQLGQRKRPQQNQPDVPPLEGSGDFSGVTDFPTGSHAPLALSQGRRSEDTVLITFPALPCCPRGRQNPPRSQQMPHGPAVGQKTEITERYVSLLTLSHPQDYFKSL